MRATITTLALMSVVFVGCRTEVPVAEDVRSVNREHLLSLRRGMSRSEVLALMGTTTVQTYKERFIPDTTNWELRLRDKRITNPHRTEIVELPGGTVAEIVFYYTDFKRPEHPQFLAPATEGLAIHDDELTPIVLENESVVGWGWAFLERNVERYEIEIRQR